MAHAQPPTPPPPPHTAPPSPRDGPSSPRSFGCLLWEVASEKQPWGDIGLQYAFEEGVNAHIRRAVSDGQRLPLPAAPPGAEGAAALDALAGRCFRAQGAERPAMGEVVAALRRLAAAAERADRQEEEAAAAGAEQLKRERAQAVALGRGVALGFLPCGLLYAALAVAGSAGGALAGAWAMAAFALGTVPVLAAIGVAGGAGARMLRGFVARAAPVALLVNAAILAAAALNSFVVR